MRRDSAARVGVPREHVDACPPDPWYRQRAPITDVQGHSPSRGTATRMRYDVWRAQAWWDIWDACRRARAIPVVSATRTRHSFSLEPPERLDKTSGAAQAPPPLYVRECPGGISMRASRPSPSPTRAGNKRSCTPLETSYDARDAAYAAPWAGAPECCTRSLSYAALNGANDLPPRTCL